MFIAKRKLPEVLSFLAYILFVCMASGLNDVIFEPLAHHQFSTTALIFIGPLYKLFFWLVPTFLYLKYVKRVEPLTYLKLNTNVGRGIKWGLLISLLFVLGFFYKHFLQGIPFHYTMGLNDWVNVFLLVGLFEEIPFRGLVFQQLQEHIGFWMPYRMLCNGM